LFLSAKPEKTNCQFLFRANSHQFAGNTLLFIPIQLLIQNKAGCWSSEAETTNSLNFLSCKFVSIRGQTLLFIPIRLLIQKPAVVFIGEARENQLPISFSR
jgi:hypothetical protein